MKPSYTLNGELRNPILIKLNLHRTRITRTSQLLDNIVNLMFTVHTSNLTYSEKDSAKKPGRSI